MLAASGNSGHRFLAGLIWQDALSKQSRCLGGCLMVRCRGNRCGVRCWLLMERRGKLTNRGRWQAFIRTHDHPDV